MAALHYITHSCHLIVLVKINRDFLEQGWKLYNSANQMFVKCLRRKRGELYIFSCTLKWHHFLCPVIRSRNFCIPSLLPPVLKGLKIGSNSWPHYDQTASSDLQSCLASSKLTQGTVSIFFFSLLFQCVTSLIWRNTFKCPRRHC